MESTDDTAAIQKAIAEHRVLYIPSGRYVVTRHHQAATGHRADRACIRTRRSSTYSTPRRRFRDRARRGRCSKRRAGGDNIVTGIGLYTGGINSRAVGALWMAGKDSLMDDVRFLGGHGTTGPDGKRVNPYSSNLASDPDPRRRWDSQYPSLWITHGGGGTFTNIWTPSTFAQSGLYISDTTTPGRVYELSSEHHVRTEIKLDQVANWELYSLQTEGEREESASTRFAWRSAGRRTSRSRTSTATGW